MAPFVFEEHNTTSHSSFVTVYLSESSVPSHHHFVGFNPCKIIGEPRNSRIGEHDFFSIFSNKECVHKILMGCDDVDCGSIDPFDPTQPNLSSTVGDGIFDSTNKLYAVIRCQQITVLVGVVSASPTNQVKSCG